MSDHHQDCERFEALLPDSPTAEEVRAWHGHLAQCPDCRDQWTAHQMLVEAFSEVAAPELSSRFEAGLRRKIEATVEVRPLSGWRAAAMLGYVLVALVALGWVFERFPLPSISIDPSSPWTVGLAIAAVPLTLWLTIGVTRWLPSRRGHGYPPLSLF